MQCPTSHPFLLTHFLFQTRSLVLINCGGGVDIVQYLGLDSKQLTVYLIDSNHPIHPANLQDESKVRFSQYITLNTKNQSQN